jgi:zinc protease
MSAHDVGARLHEPRESLPFTLARPCTNMTVTRRTKRATVARVMLRHARHLLVRLALCSFFACVAACAGSNPPPNVPPPAAEGVVAPSSPALPLDPKVTAGTLPNGLSYFLQQQKPKDKRAYLILVVKAGSVFEEDDQRGLAHFVEHMAFAGTRRFEKQALLDFFERSGLTFGSHANAFTGYDRTQYLLNVPTDDPQLLAKALDVLTDWASAVTFEPRQVDKERQVLLSEWTSSRGAARRLGEQHRQILLAGSKFAEREVIGEERVLREAPRERIVDFYRRWYRPERMAVVVVGDIDPKAVEVGVRERFGSLPPSPSDAPAAPVFEVPLRAQAITRVITDPEVPGTSVNVIFKTRTHPIATEAQQRDALVSSMATGMLGRRLDTLSQDPKAPFTRASIGFSQGVFGCLDLVSASASIKDAKVQESLDILLAELERVRRFGFTDTEIARVRQQVVRGLDSIVAGEATAEPSGVAQGLASAFVSGNVDTSAEFIKTLGTRLLGEIGKAELDARAAAWSEGAEHLVLVSGASRDAMPAEAELSAALSAVAQKPLEPYHDEVTTEPLLATLPAPGRVVEEAQVPELGVSVWTLSNGARVVVKATDFKDDQIIGQASSFGGTGLIAAKDFPSARFATDIVLSSGVGAFDRQMLGKVLAGKLASARPWLDESSEGINSSASPQDLETMFQLIHLYVTAPRRDPAAFEALRAAVREGLRNRDLSPDAVFGDTLAREVWGNSPRRLPPTLASVEEIQLERALAIYEERVGDVGDATFVFVGDIDLASLRSLVERYVASLPGQRRKEKFKDLGLHRKKGVTRVRVHEGREDKATVLLQYHGESPWSDPAHTDLVSLQSYLQLRLREVLRDQMGGVYAPQVTSHFDRVPFDAWTLSISFQCRPADIEKLEQAVREVSADVKKNGVAESYIEKLVSQRTRDLELDYRSNGFWLGRLATAYQRGDDPRQILILHDLTKRVTSDNIRLAARKYLREDQYIDAQLLPKPASETPAASKPDPAAPGANQNANAGAP